MNVKYIKAYFNPGLFSFRSLEFCCVWAHAWNYQHSSMACKTTGAKLDHNMRFSSNCLALTVAYIKRFFFCFVFICYSQYWTHNHRSWWELNCVTGSISDPGGSALGTRTMHCTTISHYTHHQGKWAIM